MLVARVKKQFGPGRRRCECPSRIEIAIADENRVELHRVDLHTHVQGPRRSKVSQRHAGVKQQRTAGPKACLCQLLRGHDAHREAGIDDLSAQRLRGANATVDDLCEADLSGVCNALLEAVESAAIEQIRRVYSMAFVPKVVGECDNPRRQAVRMVEQENFRHSSSVELRL